MLLASIPGNMQAWIHFLGKVPRYHVPNRNMSRRSSLLDQYSSRLCHFQISFILCILYRFQESIGARKNISTICLDQCKWSLFTRGTLGYIAVGQISVDQIKGAGRVSFTHYQIRSCSGAFFNCLDTFPLNIFRWPLIPGSWMSRDQGTKGYGMVEDELLRGDYLQKIALYGMVFMRDTGFEPANSCETGS